MHIYAEISDDPFIGVGPQRIKDEFDAIGGIGTLNVYLNSPGGSVFSGMTVFTMLDRHPATVNVYIDGAALSIASVIAMAADNLYIAPHGMMMIHRAWTMTVGNSNDLEETADVLKKIDGQIVDIYTSRTGRMRADIERMMDGETWMTGAEAVEMLANSTTIGFSRRFRVLAEWLI